MSYQKKKNKNVVSQEYHDFPTYNNYSSRWNQDILTEKFSTR